MNPADEPRFRRTGSLTSVNAAALRVVDKGFTELVRDVGEVGAAVAIHKIEAEPEVYGAAAYLLVVHLVRMIAGRDARSRRDILALLEIAARDADRLGNTFGKQTASLIRHVLTMKPIADSKPRH